MAIFTNVKAFIAAYNQTIPDTARPITEPDVLKLCELELIRKIRGYFASDDFKTVRSILNFIKWCQSKVTAEGEINKTPENRRVCKICRKELPGHTLNSLGRPKQYCSGCRSARHRDKNKRYQENKLFIERLCLNSPLGGA